MSNKYPIAPPTIGTQYTMYYIETENPEDEADFSTTPSLQFFSQTTGLTSDYQKNEAGYYSVGTPIKITGSEMIMGDQSTFATPTGIAYIVAKTINNYVTSVLNTGICIFTGIKEFTIDITRTGTQATKLDFTIGEITFSVDIATGATINEVIELIKNTAPTVDERPVMSARLWVGNGETAFNILPDTITQLVFDSKVALIDTHVLSVAEKAMYPNNITIAFPKKQGNSPQTFSVLLYNDVLPKLSFQYNGIRNKSFNFNFANNALTAFTYSQLGVSSIARDDLTEIEEPKYVDDYEKIYTQATGNTEPYWDGVYAGQMTDCTVNLEYNVEEAMNITGIRYVYPNGKYSVGVSGGSILNETAYDQFFKDMVINKTPSFVLQSKQLIDGKSYQMLVINNDINGKPPTISLQEGAIQLGFPSDAIGQDSSKVSAPNQFVFLHDDIADFVSNI